MQIDGHSALEAGKAAGRHASETAAVPEIESLEALRERFYQVRERECPMPDRRRFSRHIPITIETAAIASGKSMRVLQRAARIGLMRANWVGGRWWTTLAHVEEYLLDHARNRRG